MKKISVILVVVVSLCLANHCVAQETNNSEPKNDSTVVISEDGLTIKRGEDGHLDFSIGGYNISFASNAKATVQRGKPRTIDLSLLGNLEFGLTQTTSVPSSSPYAKALDFRPGFHYGMNLLTINIDLDKKDVATLYFGMNLNTNSYYYDKYMLDDSEDVLAVVPVDESYKMNKLSTFYLGVPVGFEFKVARKLIIAPEVSFDFLMNAHHKFKSPKVKTEFSGINDFAITTTLRVKYADWFGFYFKFTPTSLFESELMPKVMPYSVGVVLF